MLRSTLILFFSYVLSAVPAQAADNIEGLAQSCNGCHGMKGVSSSPRTPSIAGMSAGYLKMTLLQLKSGERHSTVMGAILNNRTDEEIAALAEYFSKQTWKSAKQDLAPAMVKKGQELAASRNCSSCHLDNGRDTSKNMPRLAGQWAYVLQTTFGQFHNPYMNMVMPKEMKKALAGLSLEDIKALAAFYASQQ